MTGDSGFLARWSRRKVEARRGVALQEPPPEQPELTGAAQAPHAAAVAPPAGAAALPVQSVDPAASAEVTLDGAKPPPPTLADVAALTRQSDFSRFVAPGVDGEVKNAALKKLFGDPHFNVMDGLDTYIDDYNKPDPLPLSSLRKMAQAAFLGLVDPEPPATAGPVTAAPATNAAAQSPDADVPAAAAASPESDEDADLRLQPHDAAGCGGAEDGAAADRPSQP
ncbi:MAG TPA: DUF3306 domain-containing protein [Burkholderiaceae bacterium]|nr:DUF3306 domain-containing protein [Burkholderiaceae bacterium]